MPPPAGDADNGGMRTTTAPRLPKGTRPAPRRVCSCVRHESEGSVHENDHNRLPISALLTLC